MSNSVAVLIAEGSNSLRIPCRIFKDVETGLKECTKILGTPKKGKGEIFWYYNSDIPKGEQIEVSENEWVTKPGSSNKEWDIAEELFTGWYFGCGGPWGFTLQEVEFNTKFVLFDLD